MSIKYCYKEEIHKSFIIPPSFNALLQDINTIFGDSIPENFSIQYKDSENDLVTISSDTEYRSMLRFDLPRSNESIKLYILPSQRGSTERIESKVIIVSHQNSEGSFEVVESEKSNVDGGVSEFTLTSDDERIDRTQRSPSSDSHESRRTDVSFDRASTSSAKNDSSDGQQGDSLDNLYQIRALLLKEFLVKSPRVVAHKVEVPLQEEDIQIKPVDIFRVDENLEPVRKLSPIPCQSLKQLIFEEEFETRTKRRVFRRLCDVKGFKLLELYLPRESYSSCDQLDQSVGYEMLTAAAIFIQKNFRGYRIRKLLRTYFDRYNDANGENSDELWSMNNDSFFAHKAEKVRIDYDNAASVIQKAFRRFIARKKASLYLQEDSFDFEQQFKRHRVHFTPRNFSHKSDQQDSRKKTITIQNDEQPADYWRWAQERVQAQNNTFEPDYRYKDSYHSNNNHLSYSYQPISLKSNNSCDSPLQWNSVTKRPRELDENLYHISVRDSPLRCDTYESYEHSRQSEDAPLHTWLNLQPRRFDDKIEFNSSPRSLESPYSVKFDDYELTHDFSKQHSMKDYKFNLMQGTSPSVTFYEPQHGRPIAYKTVYIENSGSKAWNRCYVRSVGAISEKTAEMSNVDVGQIVMVTLELSGLFNYGWHNTFWRLVHENEHGVVEVIGEPFNVEFMIESKQAPVERTREDDYTYHKQCSFITERDDEDDDNEEEENSVKNVRMESVRYKDQDAGTSYDTPSFFEQDNIQDFERFLRYKTEAVKIGEIRAMFPLDSLDEILAFVNQRPCMGTEEVVMAYLEMRNEC